MWYVHAFYSMLSVKKTYIIKIYDAIPLSNIIVIPKRNAY